jgi:hypothetical protein
MKDQARGKTALLALILLASTLLVNGSAAARVQDSSFEPVFTSPTFEYSITWSDPWFIVDREISLHFERLSFVDGQTAVYFFMSRADGSNPEASLDEFAAAFTEVGRGSNLELLRDPNGNELFESGSDFAHATYTFNLLPPEGAPVPYIAFASYRNLSPGTAVVTWVESSAERYWEVGQSWSEISDWVQPFTESLDSQAPAAAFSEGVEFYIHDGVSDQDAIIIREGVVYARNFLRRELDSSLSGDILVSALSSESSVNPDLAGMALNKGIAFYTGSAGWRGHTSPLERLGVVVHEYIHAYQFEIAGGQTDRSAAWFNEGVAEYLSVTAMAQLQISSKADFEELYLYLLERFPISFSLQQLESYDFFQAQPPETYQLSYFAAAFLFDQLKNDPRDVSLYYERLNAGERFDAAFDQAFGLSVEAFYQQFDTWLRSQGPAKSFPEDFLLPSTAVAGSLVRIFKAPKMIVSTNQYLFTAKAVPGATCRLRIVIEDTVILDRSVGTNGEGELFWLVTIPEGAEPGIGMASVSCGSLRDRSEIVLIR